MALRTSSRAESSWKCRTVASTSCWWSPTAAVGARVTRPNGGASRGDSAPGDAIGSGVGRHRLFLKRLFFIAVNGELYLPLRLSIWELSGNYLRVQTCRRDRLTGLSAHH